MSAWALLGVCLCGGVGACGRVLLVVMITQRTTTAFPVGILAVNLTGALAAGLVAGIALGADARRLVATGLLGGFTTFSTWVLQSDGLTRAGRRRVAAANLLVSLALGLAAVWLGRRIGLALDG